TVNHRRTTNSLSLYVTVRTRGGGLCIIHRDSITMKSHPLQRSLNYSSFECQLVTLHVGGPGSTAGDVTIAVIYRPPTKKVETADQDAVVLADQHCVLRRRNVRPDGEGR